MPEPANSDRADWAENAVNVFAAETYCGRTFTDTVVEQPEKGDDAYTMVTDLIADLLHLADRHGWSADDIMGSARNHYDEEKAEVMGNA